jgi:Ca-activated chloride channel family protein
MKRALFVSAVLVIAAAAIARADGFIVPRPIPPDVEMPPSLSVKYHHVEVDITNQVALTTVDQVFVNHHHRDIEGTYIFPISAQAAISDFSMFVGSEEIRGKILDKNEARRIYEEIVRRRRDPALLEYFGDGMFQASVYPIPAHGETRIRLHYSEVLERDAGLSEYRYTLGTERFSRDALETVELKVKIESKRPITSIYSPSHDIRVERQGDYRATVTYVEEGTRPDKDFLLYYAVSEEEIGVDLLTFEDENHERFFLTLISPRIDLAADRTSRKNIVFILDTSGSMQGEKIEQAKGALAFCLSGLEEGDRFNVIDFDDEVRPFAGGLVPADRRRIAEALDFVEGTRAEGGTNINDALARGLGEIGHGGRTSFIIFLTDGLPTVGETDIQTILENVERANRSETRLFVFGVGYDVNTRLLDRLAGDHHGASDYVHPTEDIEVKVSNFFTKVSRPILTEVELRIEGVETYDLYPKELPDVFQGSQILVLGRYNGSGRARLTLSGRGSDATRTRSFGVNFSGGRRNDFVPRLWATRKVGYLIDEIRTRGENRELVTEIVRLSKKYGIMTEYTSFFVDADYRVTTNDLIAPVEKSLAESAKKEVGGVAVNRSQASKTVMQAPRAVDSYKDAEGNERKVTQIVPVGERTFYEKGGVWVDSEFEGQAKTLKIKKFSKAYFELLDNAPAVAKYCAVGDAVIFVINGAAVEISDEGKSEFSAFELRSLVGKEASGR